MKTNSDRPWLTGSGVEVPTSKLRAICETWNAPTWEAYLKWYASPRREALVAFSTYEDVCEEQMETIFESLVKSETPAKGRLIALILSQIPDREAEVLRAIYLEGRTQVDIRKRGRLATARWLPSSLKNLSRWPARFKLVCG